MPHVTIQLLEGRTTEQKAAVAKAVTEALVTLAGSKPADVNIVFVDVARDDWATAGRLLSAPPD
jgi:4-oxalocrotonate tautomerase